MSQSFIHAQSSAARLTGLGAHQAGYRILLAFDLNDEAVISCNGNMNIKSILAGASEISCKELADANEITLHRAGTQR